MGCIVVVSDKEITDEVARQEQKGLKLASISNAGLRGTGKWRLTFLTKEEFYGEDRLIGKSDEP